MKVTSQNTVPKSRVVDGMIVFFEVVLF